MATTPNTGEVSPELIAAVLQHLQNNGTTVGSVQVAATKAAPRKRDIRVVANEGDALKYGDLTIGKQNDDGRFMAKLGLNVDDVEPLIKALRAAKKEATQG